MRFRRASLSPLAAAVLALAGCVTDGTVGGPNPEIPSATSSAQLRGGDSLTVSLQGVPDPSTQAVQIDDQGSISLPFIGPVSAAGLNAGELATRIRETYLARKIYNAVDVSVSVTERFVYVGGEVMRPGRIVWTPDLTVAKAIQAAGGFSLYAKETRVSLVRDQKSYDVDVKLAQKRPEQDPRLVPGDAIQVPRSPF
ncbi:polysaccharide biosynthesis/export family protein [Opitutus terrae]|uniref:Polysaccharide export protein n=1 Tax=Opitutus terrae (strain DSM 11246 / JCM 15787 / PB90-1) TaxID=452637 RepID=B1ZSY1_OPITP|nr:polysaccharide biosynthesis/export family protein [Opitutus terrae]ACB75770.1 polysaccharide export protein [Opitutus terrae PB90-1]